MIEGLAVGFRYIIRKNRKSCGYPQLFYKEALVIFRIVYYLFDEDILKEVCEFEMGYISFVFGDKNKQDDLKALYI